MIHQRKRETLAQFHIRKRKHEIVDRITNDPKYTHKYNDSCVCEECDERFNRVLDAMLDFDKPE